jgi:thioredoxin-like negative regulator of GroEL
LPYKRWGEVAACVQQKQEEYDADLDSASALMNSGRFANAIPYLKTVLQADDDSHNADMLLAQVTGK